MAFPNFYQYSVYVWSITVMNDDAYDGTYEDFRVVDNDDFRAI